MCKRMRCRPGSAWSQVASHKASRHLKQQAKGAARCVTHLLAWPEEEIDHVRERAVLHFGRPPLLRRLLHWRRKRSRGLLPLLLPLGRRLLQLLLLLRRGLPLRGSGLRLLALLLRLRLWPTLHRRLALWRKPRVLRLLPGLLCVMLLLRLQLSHLLLHVVLRLLLGRRRLLTLLLLLLTERVLLCLLRHGVRLRLRLRGILMLGLRLLAVPWPRAALLPLLAGRVLHLLVLDPVLQRLGLGRGTVLLRQRGVGRRVRR